MVFTLDRPSQPESPIAGRRRSSYSIWLCRSRARDQNGADMTSRRAILRGGLAAAGLAAVGIPDWALPVLAEGETLVPFTDIPANFATNPSEVVRVFDIRKLEAVTPKDQF